MEFIISTGISLLVLGVGLWNAYNNAQIKNSLLTLEISIKTYLENHYVPITRFNDLKEDLKEDLRNLKLSMKG